MELVVPNMARTSLGEQCRKRVRDGTSSRSCAGVRHASTAVKQSQVVGCASCTKLLAQVHGLESTRALLSRLGLGLRVCHM